MLIKYEVKKATMGMKISRFKVTLKTRVVKKRHMCTCRVSGNGNLFKHRRRNAGSEWAAACPKGKIQEKNLCIPLC